jgi:hypothetical protein
MIVLEGEILMHLDGVEHAVVAGGVASAPRGVLHTFKTTALGTTRVLCLHTPGCCQSFYWDASDPTDDESAALHAPPDRARVMASAQKHGGIEILGPPPFD